MPARSGQRFKIRLACADHRRWPRHPAWQFHSSGQLSEVGRQPERGGTGLVQCTGDHWRARHRPTDPLEGWVLAGNSAARRRQIYARWEDHPRRMGTAARATPAVRLSADGSQPAGCRGAAEHEGPSRGVALEDRARQGHRADLPAGAAGQAVEAVGSRAGCRAGAG